MDELWGFHEGNALVEEVGSFGSSTNYLTRAFPSRRVGVGQANVVLSLHEKDVAGVEGGGVNLDQNLSGQQVLRVLYRHLGETNSGMFFNDHGVHDGGNILG